MNERVIRQWEFMPTWEHQILGAGYGNAVVDEVAAEPQDDLEHITGYYRERKK